MGDVNVKEKSKKSLQKHVNIFFFFESVLRYFRVLA